VPVTDGNTSSYSPCRGGDTLAVQQRIINARMRLYMCVYNATRRRCRATIRSSVGDADRVYYARVHAVFARVTRPARRQYLQTRFRLCSRDDDDVSVHSLDRGRAEDVIARVRE